MHRLSLLVMSIALVSTQVACVMNTVPPPSAPEASMPDVGELPTAGGGMARVVIATDVPARVERITHRVVRTDRETATATVLGGEGLVCTETPCAVTLPYGEYELVFKGTRDDERVSHFTLMVKRETVVLNHTLGRVHTPSGQRVAVVLAGLGLGILMVAGAVAEHDVDTGRRRSADDSTIPAIAGAGLGTMILGGLVGIMSPGTRQEGSSTQWSPRGLSAGASVGLRF